MRVSREFVGGIPGRLLGTTVGENHGGTSERFRKWISETFLGRAFWGEISTGKMFDECSPKI